MNLLIKSIKESNILEYLNLSLCQLKMTCPAGRNLRFNIFYICRKTHGPSDVGTVLRVSTTTTPQFDTLIGEVLAADPSNFSIHVI